MTQLAVFVGTRADRFGGKWLFGVSVLLSSAISLLTPAAAGIHVGVLITLRVLSGLGEGARLPATHALIARWSESKYHSTVVTVIVVGAGFGALIGTFLAGVLCDHGFAGGWPSVFYVFGAVGCIWSVVWFLLCYNSPSTHPRISAVELKYWETTIGTRDLTAHPPTPWRKILSSAPVWALAAAFFAHNRGYYTIATCLPLYMYDVLGVDMTTNGALSAAPFVIVTAMFPASGVFADWLRSPGRLSTNVVRKIFVSGFTLSGCFFILTGYTGCNSAAAIATVCAAMACASLGYSTVFVNQLDLAPLHAGKIMGLSHTIGNFGSIAAPLAVSAFTIQQQTRSEWQNVFFVTAAVCAVGVVVFVIFGSGNRQSWADGSTDDELRDIVSPNKEQTEGSH